MMCAGSFQLVRVATPLPFFLTRLKFQPQTQERVATAFQPYAGAAVAPVFSLLYGVHTHKTQDALPYLHLRTGERRETDMPYRFFGNPQSFELRRARMERVRRIELPPSDWKSEVLPLNYTRILRAGERMEDRRGSSFRAVITGGQRGACTAQASACR